MIRLLHLVIFIFLTQSLVYAQDGINYQGAATNANGDELSTQNISIRASILSGSATGNLEWQETHSTTTDQFGLFNIVIGQGTNTANGATTNFNDVDWGSGNHFLKIEMDATGGTNYNLIGTTQMMSVPYALYAKSAGIDSAAIAAMIGSNGLGNGGGCDYKFPDGLKGTPIIWDLPNNPYTVPTGKNLYISAFFGSGSGDDLKIDGKKMITSSGDNWREVIVVGSGSVVSTLSSSSAYPSNIVGILVDANVSPITWHLPGNNYTVPSGKNLYITAFNGSGIGGQLKIDGLNIIFPSGNNWKEVIVVGAGSVISTLSTSSAYHSNINGYLVDENYFANCGVGGSSSSSSNNVSVSTFGDTLTMNGQSIIVPGISFSNVAPVFGSVTDIDGNSYQTVSHGNIEIMAENLKVERFNNGDPIAEICYCGTNTNHMCSSPGWTYYACQNSNLSNGRLYIGYTVSDSRNVCPSGWHIATANEWIQLLDLFVTDYLPNGDVDVSAIISTGSNQSGLSILLGGDQGPGGSSWANGKNQYEGMWYSQGVFYINTSSNNFPQYNINPNPNFSGGYDFRYIRCVKD